QLGAGGLAAVYLAEDKSKRMVAVKESVIPPLADVKLKEKAREMFKRESQMLSRVNHPQIVKVLDHFVENERDYLVLEYLPGRTLRELVRKDGAQEPEQVRDWAIQIAGILDYLHNQEPPLVHRDLTPDNLVITADGVVHLIDFGASNEFVGQATGTFVGKQLYIAPEQFRGKAEPASDIYAMGATLYFLLTGKDPSALAESHPKRALSSLSDDWDRLVADATKLSVGERFSSAADLLVRLQSMDKKEGADETKEDSGTVIKVPREQKKQAVHSLKSVERQ
ncbi:MAG: serine/threonine protein kinase, partial [Cyanobacteria bacterium]|nr:serine/threonine protein kinase [Cyanobacteriota bacterium]